jgi:adenosylcobyric acid synthase
VYGSIQLLPTSQRDLIKGIIINKFRGDSTLFEEGKKQLEALTGKPVVGVIPYLDDLFIEQEDSVMLERVNRQADYGKINLAVILLPHMSNFTDFNALERHPDVHLYYATQPDDLQQAAIMLLPGTKNTLADLDHLWKSGLAKPFKKPTCK